MEFKPIKGYEGIYEACSDGTIWTCEGKTTYSNRHGRIIKRVWKRREIKPQIQRRVRSNHKEFYAIAKDNNNFLAEYKNNDRSLTFTAKTTDDIRFALIFEKGNEETGKSMENLAKAVGGRLVKIKAEYEITEEDGSELKEPEVNNEEDEFKAFLNHLLKRGLE